MPEHANSQGTDLFKLANALQTGSTEAAVTQQLENAVIQAVDDLVIQLSSENPRLLRQHIEKLHEVPLSQAINRHWLCYYHGLALGLCEEYDAALVTFDALLTTPAVAQAVQARTLNSRAVFCRITGRLEEAMVGYRASLAIWQQLQDRLNVGKVLTNLGIIAYQLQEYRTAERELLAAAAAFAQVDEPARQAAVQNELGLLYRDQGRWAEALTCFAAFAAHCRANQQQDLLGRAFNNQGEVLLLQGNVMAATAAFEAALAQMTNRVYRVDLYLNLGLAALATGDGADAQAAFRQARDLAHAIGRRDILAQVHYRLGVLWQQQGDQNAAYTELLTAVTVIEATREPLRDEGLKISLLGRWQQIYEALVLLLFALERTVEALLWAERARARSFAEAGGLYRQPTQTNNTAQQVNWPATAPIDHTLLKTLQAALLADQVVFCYFTTGVLDHTEPFLRALAKDNPLRSHLLTPARTLLFVINQTNVTAHLCPIDPNAFTTQARRQEDRSRFFAEGVLAGLRQKLFPPDTFPSLLMLTYRRCYLVPHGPLHNVPFGALLLPELIHTPSLALLSTHLALQAHSTTLAQVSGADSLLAVGYNGGQQALRHTETEALLVATLTGGVAWTGADAKLAELPRRAAQVRLLHLACHGWFDYDNPLQSYLETGAEERLTAQMVLDNWRLNSALVVLSACQSGVNRVLRGDEPMGLIRGFLAAGAKLVLATSWPVADLPTFLLMSRFYGEITDGRIQKTSPARLGDPAAALVRAQTWLRCLTRAEVKLQIARLTGQFAGVSVAECEQDLPDGEQPFAHPRAWAGFVLYAG